MAETLITDRSSGSAHYKILRRLGKGGMAEVFLARQEGMAGLRRLTVVKKLLPQYSQMADVAEMLLDEARIAAQLTHPNIVQIFELGKEDGQYFIVMEFVDGCDLATLARIERHRGSRVPLRLALRAVSEAAMGLDFAHRKTGLDGRPLNIVHRDVSPHNIMCSREGIVKVTDFGIAKAVGKAQVTQVGVVKGKVQYMSPEQYTGGPVDHRSDIYSLGVVLYQLSTGRLPRVGDDGEVVIRRVLEGKIPRPTEIRPDYPEDLEAIVMRALAHKPDDRYPDAAALRDDLLDFARENDLLAFPKDLGDYVNALVPPVPLVVREKSTMQVSRAAIGAEARPLPATGRPPHSSPSHRLPSVIVEGEDLDTAAPAGTEPASPRPVIRPSSKPAAGAGAGPFDRTDPSLRSPRLREVSRAGLLVDEEKETPLSTSQAAAVEPASPITPVVGLREQPLQPREAHLIGPDPASEKERPEVRNGKLATPAAEEAGSSEPTPPRTAPTATGGASALTQPTRRRPHGGMLVVGGLLLGLGAAAVLGLVLWLVGNRPPSPPPPRLEPGGTVGTGAGVINVLANPSLATVSVDGAQRCPSTPCQIAGLPLNRELLITLRAPGHTLWMQRMVLTASEPKLLLRADLSPEPAATPPTAAEAGPAPSLAKSVTDETKKSRRPAGKKSGRSGPPIAHQAGKVKSIGKMTTVDIDEPQAVLAVDMKPWAEVWIDGQKVGHTPMQLALPPGRHTVELKNAELGYHKTYRIRAQPKKKVKISEALQPPPGAGGPPGG